MAEAIPDERYRTLSPLPRGIVTVFSIVLIVVSVIYIFNIFVFGRVMVVYGYLNLIQAMIFPLAFLFFPAHSKARRDKLPWYDILLACLGFAIPFTFFLNAYDIIFKGWEMDAPAFLFVLALIYWPLILEGVRRVTGKFLSIFLLVVSLYPLFSAYAPGDFQSQSFSLYRIVNFHMFSGQSVNGLVMSVLGKLFIGFLLFGVVLVHTGAGKAFMGIAMALMGSVRGGAAKVAVVSSALVASISGSVVTNVLTTGPFTIPAMKKAGYSAHYAGAIETCASTGGALTPPVMGAVAFLMASFLDISYIKVALAATVPAVLYYLGLFVQVDGYAAKAGIKGLPKSEIPSLGKAIREVLPYFLALAILIWLLLILRREAQAPYYAIAYLLVIAMLRKETRFGFKGFINLIQTTGKLLAELLPTFLGIGFVLGSLMISGAAQSLILGLLNLAGGNVYLLLITGAFTGLILGMGLTVSAIYLLLAILLAPALIAAGLDRMAVHLFIVYTGILSYITPPVAIGAYAAAAIAGCSGMKIGFQAVRLGLVLFIIPFLFVLNPAFILHGTPLEIIHVVGTGILGVVLLASGVEGYLVKVGRLALVPRVITLVSGVMLFLPEGIFDVIGVALITSLALFRFSLRRRAQ